MTDPEDRIWNLVKELNDRENKRPFWKEVGTALFGLFVVLVFLLALNQGFNICMKPSGDCSRDPDSLLFKPREN
jgi:hypothetical protein